MALLMVGVFETEADLHRTITRLAEETEIKAKDISLIGRDKKMMDNMSKEAGTKAPQTGPASSGIAGSLRHITSGLDVMAEPVTAAGPAALTAAGAGITGGKENSLAVSLTGYGIPKQDAIKYERHVEQDRMLLLLTCEREQQEKITAILSECGALNVG